MDLIKAIEALCKYVGDNGYVSITKFADNPIRWQAEACIDDSIVFRELFANGGTAREALERLGKKLQAASTDAAR